MAYLTFPSSGQGSEILYVIFQSYFTVLAQYGILDFPICFKSNQIMCFTYTFIFGLARTVFFQLCIEIWEICTIRNTNNAAHMSLMYYIHVTGLRTSILDHNLLNRAFILIALDNDFLDCVVY